MSDFDQTIYSNRGTSGMPAASPPPPVKPKRNMWLIGGGIGCALLLCVALVVTGGVFMFRDQLGLNERLSGFGLATESPTATMTATPEPIVKATEIPPTTEVTTEAVAPTDEATPEPTEPAATATPPTSPTPTSEPKFGKVTFAIGATADYKPISPTLTFQEGITQVHAIFEYSGMSKDYTWERVWYLEGKEVLRNAQAWSGDTAGIFDYFINAGKDPLFPGKWKLELYVKDKLLTQGNFIIEPKAKELAEAEPTAELKATPTLTPTATRAPSPTPVAGSGNGGGSGGGGGTYQLVYTKWDGGQHNLYVADTNGRGERFLLNRAAGPSWMPNGQTIFFYGEQGIDRQRLADGRDFVFDGISNGIVALINAAQLPTADAAVLAQPIDWKQGTARWTSVSPDGTMVAFDAKPGGSDYRIYFLGTADNQQFRFEILGEQADWSPNSQQVVYRSGRDGKTGIWISNRDDSGHTNITNAGSDSFPAWSPDGKTIAFSREEGGNVDIYLVNVDGSNLRRITEAPGPDSLPIYTPSGDIIFRSARSGNWGIWKMSGSGANQTEIIPNAGVGPDWSFSKMDVR